MKLKWSNEKPKTSGVYNVLYRTDAGEFVTACYFDGTDTWYHDVGINHDRIVTDKVIMWQPLPEKPKDNEHRQHTKLLEEARYYRNLLNPEGFRKDTEKSMNKFVEKLAEVAKEHCKEK